MAAVINFIKRIKDLTYLGSGQLTKTHQLVTDKSGLTELKSILVSDITDISFNEAKHFIATLEWAKIKGTLDANFNSVSLNPSDYDMYFVKYDNLLDVSTALNYYKGIIYWKTNKFEQFTFEYDLTYKGNFTTNFDSSIISGLRMGNVYRIDVDGISDSATGQTFNRGSIYMGIFEWIVLTEEEKRSQEIVINSSSLQITDFYAKTGKFLAMLNGTDQSDNCILDEQTQIITVPSEFIGKTIKIINIK